MNFEWSEFGFKSLTESSTPSDTRGTTNVGMPKGPPRLDYTVWPIRGSSRRTLEVAWPKAHHGWKTKSATEGILTCKES